MGIEDPGDLVADLEQALAKASPARVFTHASREQAIL